MEKKFMRESKAIKTTRVFPNDLNNHQTLFGGKLLAEIDSIASIAAATQPQTFVEQHLSIPLIF